MTQIFVCPPLFSKPHIHPHRRHRRPQLHRWSPLLSLRTITPIQLLTHTAPSGQHAWSKQTSGPVRSLIQLPPRHCGQFLTTLCTITTVCNPTSTETTTISPESRRGLCTQLPTIPPSTGERTLHGLSDFNQDVALIATQSFN